MELSRFKWKSFPDVRIPDHSQHVDPGALSAHTVFNILVKDGSDVWFVMKRYTEFKDLHEKLQAQFKDVAGFPDVPPERSFFSTESLATFLDKRRVALQQYLNDLIRIAPILHSAFVRSFLQPPATLKDAYKGRAKPDSLFYIPPPPPLLTMPAIISLPPETPRINQTPIQKSGTNTKESTPTPTPPSSGFHITMRPEEEDTGSRITSDDSTDGDPDGSFSDGQIDTEEGFFLIPEQRHKSLAEPDAYGKDSDLDGYEESELVWNSDPHVIMSNRMKNVLIESGLLDDKPPTKITAIEMKPMFHREIPATDLNTSLIELSTSPPKAAPAQNETIFIHSLFDSVKEHLDVLSLLKAKQENDANTDNLSAYFLFLQVESRFSSATRSLEQEKALLLGIARRIQALTQTPRKDSVDLVLLATYIIQCEDVLTAAISWATSFETAMMEHKIRFAERQTRIDSLRSSAEKLILELTNDSDGSKDTKVSLNNLVAEIDKELTITNGDSSDRLAVNKSLVQLKEFIHSSMIIV